MNIRDLEYLVALAEHKHFRRAADACNVSQPTLSGQIRKLEEELGTTLLERTSRKVLFTQAGLLLVRQAKTVLQETKRLKEMASNQGKEMVGPVHIGIIPTLGPYLLPHILLVLNKEFPKLEPFFYEAQTTQLNEQLEAGYLDCAIMAKIDNKSPFIEVPLFDEKLFLTVPEKHNLAKASSISLESLKNEEIMLLADGHCLRDQTLDYCFAVGAKENSHFQATSLETLRNMVSINAGITLMPHLAMLNDVCHKGIHYIPCVKPEPKRKIQLVYRPGSPLRQRYQRIADVIIETIAPILQES